MKEAGACCHVAALYSQVDSSSFNSNSSLLSRSAASAFCEAGSPNAMWTGHRDFSLNVVLLNGCPEVIHFAQRTAALPAVSAGAVLQQIMRGMA